MAKIILTGHGEFASGLASALSMVAGDVLAFSAITFTQDDAQTYPETLAKAIEDGIKNQGSVLVFCDLKGGTPFNCAMLQAAEDGRIEVVAGVNLPTLIETVFAHQLNLQAPAQELAEIAMNAATSSIERENKKTFALQHIDMDSDDEDGI